MMKMIYAYLLWFYAMIIYKWLKLEKNLLLISAARTAELHLYFVVPFTNATYIFSFDTLHRLDNRDFLR